MSFSSTSSSAATTAVTDTTHPTTTYFATSTDRVAQEAAAFVEKHVPISATDLTDIPTQIPRLASVFLDSLGRDPEPTGFHPNLRLVSHALDRLPAVITLGDEQHGPFVLTALEVLRLRDTHRICTSRHLPKSFLSSVLWMFADDAWVEYNSYTRSLPLSPTPDQRTEMERRFATTPGAEPAALYCTSFKRTELDFRRARVVDKMLEVIPRQVDVGGFNSASVKADLGATLSTPLTQLNSHIVHSIKGYFLMDATMGVCSKTCVPIAFVSAGAPDFTSITSSWQEHGCYFVEDGRFQEGARAALLQRVRETYLLILKSFELQGAREVVLPALGLSLISSLTEREAVAQVYFEALLDVLLNNNTSERKLWPFETVYMNPTGQYYSVARRVLDAASASVSTSSSGSLLCPVILHLHSSVALAYSLSKLGKHVGLLVPCQGISVLTGRVGAFWSCEDKSSFTAEDFISATSTLLLQHYNVCGEVQLEKVMDHTDLPQLAECWQPVTKPLGFEAFQEP